MLLASNQNDFSLSLASMWKEINGKLVCELKFESFALAFSFLNEVAASAERLNHHPTIYNEYNLVRLELTTHDAGGVVTPLDWELAQAINETDIKGKLLGSE